jgi:hypothetical protein
MERNAEITADAIYVLAITVFVLSLTFGASFILNIGLCIRIKRLTNKKQEFEKANLGYAATCRESEAIEWLPPPSPPPEALQSSSPVASPPEFNRPLPQQPNNQENENIYDDVNVQESRPLPQPTRTEDENIYDDVTPGNRPLLQPEQTRSHGISNGVVNEEAEYEEIVVNKC